MGGVRGCGLAVFALALLMTTKVGAGQAADVVYAHGDVRVMDAAGAAQPVRRGMAVQSGQTLVTGQGRLQMRMSDGGFIALQPDTQFRIDEYNYAGAEDGSERSFFNLVKGGIRFITGAIGHRNKENFRIKTAVATIGIRGSAGRANLCDGGSCGGNPDGLYVTGNQDTLTLQNEKDSQDIEPGETFYTECATCDIREVDAGPNAYAAVTPGEGEQEEDNEGEGEGAPGAPAEGGYAVGDQRDAEGDLIGLPDNPVIPVPESGDLIASVVGAGSSSRPELAFLVGVDKNPPTAITGVESSSGVLHSAVLGTATVKDSYSSANGALFLARWGGGTYTDIQDGVSRTETLSGEQGLHFAYGTSATVSESALSSGATAFYDLAGFTAPTRASGSGAPGTVTGGTLAVNFSTEPSAELLGMTVQQGGATYSVSTGPMDILLLSASGGGVNPIFSDIGTAVGTGRPGACANGCGVDVAGFLSGSANSTIGTIPSHAGLTYTIRDADPLSGAAGFEFNGEVSAP